MNEWEIFWMVWMYFWGGWLLVSGMSVIAQLHDQHFRISPTVLLVAALWPIMFPVFAIRALLTGKKS